MLNRERMSVPYKFVSCPKKQSLPTFLEEWRQEEEADDEAVKKAETAILISYLGQGFEKDLKKLMATEDQENWGLTLLYESKQIKQVENFLIENEDSLPEHCLVLCCSEKSHHEIVRFNVQSLQKILERNARVKQRVLDIGERITKTSNQLEIELAMIKKIQEKVNPLRSETFRSLNVTTRYMAGESAGGEFFDFIRRGNQLLVFASSSRSYLLSSGLMTLFLRYKDVTLLTEKLLETLIKELQSEINFVVKDIDERANAFNLFVSLIDLNSYHIQGYHFGGFQLHSSKQKAIFIDNSYPVDKSFMEPASFSYSVSREEKMALISPGMARNLEIAEAIAREQVPNFLNQFWHESSQEMTNELFYRVKGKQEGDFLPYDASFILMEVGAHAIKEI